MLAGDAAVSAAGAAVVLLASCGIGIAETRARHVVIATNWGGTNLNCSMVDKVTRLLLLVKFGSFKSLL